MVFAWRCLIRKALLLLGILAGGIFSIALLGAVDVRAQPPSDPGAFYAGIYADSAWSVDCVVGPAGTSFDQFVWVWVPEELGVTYLTFRIVFPTNLDKGRYKTAL